MLLWLSVNLNERFADVTQHNKSAVTHIHMLIAAGDEFHLFDERDYRRAPADFGD
jgi:hypothetical protein